MTTIRILRLRPGRSPEAVEIENTLEAQQAEVGGYLEMLQLGDGLAVFFNEDGLRLKLAPLGKIADFEIVGAAFCARVDGEGETVSVTKEDVEAMKKMFVPRKMN
jgi:uncharacterized protein DUF3846